MKDWQNIVVLAGAVVFAIFLLWRLRPVQRAVGTMAASTLQARLRAREAKTVRERARILTEAAAQLAGQRGTTFAAMSLLLRALHADPSWPDPIDHLRTLLWFRRPHALERILLKRLARSDWDADHRAVAVASARILSDLYRARLRDRVRAQVFERLAERIEQTGAAPSPAQAPPGQS
jgi:hypothetical protein